MGVYLRLLPGVKVQVARRGVRWGSVRGAAGLHLCAGGPGVCTGTGPFTWCRSLRRIRRR
jgi:hypothetical protein